MGTAKTLKERRRKQRRRAEARALANRIGGNPINPQTGLPYPARGASNRAQKRLERVLVWTPPELRLGESTGATIDELIERMQRELLEDDDAAN